MDEFKIPKDGLVINTTSLNRPPVELGGISPDPSVLVQEYIVSNDGRYVVPPQESMSKNSLVFRGQDTFLGINRDVCIKMLTPGTSETDAVTTVGEAKILARMDNPNIPKIHDITFVKLDEDSELLTPVIVEEYIEGKSIKSYELEWVDVLDGFTQIADAIDYIHTPIEEANSRPKIFHLDIKPGNMLMKKVTTYDGNDHPIIKYRAYLIDFATNNILKGFIDEKGSPTISGTPGYISPRLLSKEEYDENMDHWAFVTSLYTTLTNELPFGEEDDPSDTTYRVLDMKNFKPIKSIIFPSIRTFYSNDERIKALNEFFIKYFTALNAPGEYCKAKDIIEEFKSIYK